MLLAARARRGLELTRFGHSPDVERRRAWQGARALSSRKQEPIRVWDRALGREIEEQVYGEGGVRFMYENTVGRSLGKALFARRWFSQLYGWLQSTRWSGRKVAPFIERYVIPMAEYEPGPFPTFNDFFVRRFAEGARPWATEADQMPAFGTATQSESTLHASVLLRSS